ncbi:uncharacterized protein LOC111089164 [Limulus polyphemus]|uniref:Uncharacterized protein LOC111089164 n=1 Tax=Limulus polyphemus TaxID=6850 RepID=A0ABM1TLQ8_LIMPO|nr:uncharacterized protein LOC111089164 [Limulus polyphemus]
MKIAKAIFCLSCLAVVFLVSSAQSRYGNRGGIGYGGVGDSPYNGYEEGSHGNTGYNKPRCGYYCQLKFCNYYECFYACRLSNNCRTVTNVGIYGRRGTNNVIEVTKPVSEKVDSFNYIPPGDETTSSEGAIVFG